MALGLVIYFLYGKKHSRVGSDADSMNAAAAAD
jgi:hypothetical protein